MEALKSYLVTAMLASIASSAVIRISDPRHRSYIRYISGLALLLLLAAPLTSVAKELADSLSDIETPAVTEDSYEDNHAFVGELGRTMSVQIGDLVASRFHLPRESIAVKLTLDLSDLSAISIYQVDVMITGIECDMEAIDRYLTDSLNCEVDVIRVPQEERQ